MSDVVGHCPVCSSGRIRPKPFGYPYKDRWLGGYECAECGIIFVYPQPSAEELLELSSKEYFDGDFRCGHQGSYFDDRTLAAVVDQSLLDRIGRVKSGGRFLEIGCAGGAFLDAARKRGYVVRGVEFSRDAAQVARDRFGLEVVTGDVCDAGFAEGSWDVVFMGDVIEHLTDPVSTLREIRRITSSGGLLVLVCPSQTHTIFSRLGFALYTILGMKVSVDLPPYHLFEYRPASIRNLLRISGFEVIDVSESMISPGRVSLRGSAVRRVAKKIIQYPNFLITGLFGVLGDRLEVLASRP